MARSRTRKRVFDALRILVCVGALWLVLRGVTLDDHVTLLDGTDLAGRLLSDANPVEILLLDGSQRTVHHEAIRRDTEGSPEIIYGLKSTWRNSRKELLFLAVVLHFLVTFPLALRFQRLLAVQQIALGYFECFKLSLAGNFLNFATPFGSNAGDVFKAYFASLHTDRKSEAVATVVMDRVIGLGSLVLMVALIACFSPSPSRLATLRPYMLTLLAGGVVGAGLYLAPPLRRLWSGRVWLERLPLFEQLRRMDQAARTLAVRVGEVLISLALSIGLQALALGAYFAVAVALDFEAHVGNMLEYFAYFYTGALVQALPGPPQGLGTVELTYRYFFAPYASASQIVCMAFAIRVVVLVSALPGLLVTATGAYRPRLDAPVATSAELRVSPHTT